MSYQIKIARTETNLPLNLFLTDSQGPVTGATAAVAIRDGDTSNSYLDFDDVTFKTSGHTTRQQPMTEDENGVYTLVGGLDVSSIVNLPAATIHLLAEYEVTAPVEALGISSDTVLLETTALVQADIQSAMTAQGYTSGRAALLDNLDTPLSGIAIRLVLVEKLLRNRLETDSVTGVVTLYDDDDTTPLLTASIFQDTAGTIPYAGAGLERRNRLV